jgi:hypothetical protein
LVATTVPPAPDPLMREALAALRKAVAAHDRPDLLATLAAQPDAAAAPNTERPPPRVTSQGIGWRLGLAALLWLSALVGLALIVRAVGPGLRWPDRALPFGVALAAWLVRTTLDPALLHCNNHGIEDARLLVAADPGEAWALLMRYGPTWFAPHRWLTQLLGADLDAMLRAAAGLGALAAAVTGLAARIWTGSRAAGLMAGMLVAVLPVAARVGWSESPNAAGQVAVALVVFAVAAIRCDMRGGRWLLVCALAIVSWGHTFAPGLAVALVVLFTADLARGTLLRRVLVLSAWLAIPLIVFAILVLLGDASNRDRAAAATLQEMSPWKPLSHVLWLDPRWTPWPLAVAWVIGLAALTVGTDAWPMRAARVAGLWLAVAVLAFIGGSVSVSLRYQALIAPVLAWLAVAAFGPWWRKGIWAEGFADARSIAAGLAGLACVAAAGMSVVHGPLHAWRDVESASFASVAPVALPQRAVVLVPDRSIERAVEIVVDFPDWRWSPPPTVLHVAEFEQLALERRLPPDAPVFVWRSPLCQAFARVVGQPPSARDDQGRRIQPRCQRLLRLVRGPALVEGRQPVAVNAAGELPAEFHQYLAGDIAWGLYPAGTVADH